MDETKLSITEHLSELRGRLIKSLLGILITTSVALIFSPKLLDYSIEPLQRVLQTRNRIITLVVQPDEDAAKSLVTQLESNERIRMLDAAQDISAAAEAAHEARADKHPIDLIMVSTRALGETFIESMDAVDALAVPTVAYLVKDASDPLVNELRFEAVQFVREAPRRAVLDRLVSTAAGRVGKAQREKLVVLSPLEPFFAWIKIALVVGLFLACPVWLYQAWMFIAPGMYDHERRFALPVIASSSLLFVGGGAFAYFLMFPMMFDVLVNQMLPETLNTAFTVENYLGLLLRLTVAFGIVFETPLALTLLSVVGIVTPDGLRRWRKYALIIAFVAGAILTPADPLSQLMMALPLIAFYEIGIIASTIVSGKRAARRAAEEDQSAA